MSFAFRAESFSANLISAARRIRGRARDSGTLLLVLDADALGLLAERFEDLLVEGLRTVGDRDPVGARGEVRRMIENVEHATGVTTLMTSYTLEDIAKDIDCMGHKQPLGVFAAIVPYNFPGMVAWWFLPYALVTGNTFIVKPSELVPMTQTKIFEILEDVGIPEGVLNMVHGSRDVVNGLLDHPDIEGISFVGSTPTAKYIYQRCGETGKRVQALVLTPTRELAQQIDLMPTLLSLLGLPTPAAAEGN